MMDKGIYLVARCYKNWQPVYTNAVFSEIMSIKQSWKMSNLWYKILKQFTVESSSETKKCSSQTPYGIVSNPPEETDSKTKKMKRNENSIAELYSKGKIVVTLLWIHANVMFRQWLNFPRALDGTVSIFETWRYACK